MKSIGGFLDLEQRQIPSSPYHHTLALSTARACFYYLINSLRPTQVYLPYYTCDALLEPLIVTKTPYTLYSIDCLLEIETLPTLRNSSELLLYINYFDLKYDYALKLVKQYKNQIVIDNTQAFFRRKVSHAWSFNSARKYFGVPDGAYLYSPSKYVLEEYFDPATPNYEHLFPLMFQSQNDAYQAFVCNESLLSYELKGVSDLSKKLFTGIDYQQAGNRRHHNFKVLHQLLTGINQLDDELFYAYNAPLYYPLLLGQQLRDKLIARSIFVPKLWAEVESRYLKGFSWEKRLSKYLLPLPVDQRYDEKDMNLLANHIKRELS